MESARRAPGCGRLRRSAACLVGALLAASAAARTEPPDPAPFDAVLEARARGGGFDYRAATGQDRKRLAAYLANLADADPAGMRPEARKAFWINAYNGWAIQTLLDHPGKRITDVSGAFDKERHRIGGELATLDDVENRLRALGDARIHFAIVCASRSCPPLAPRAYRAEVLEEALERQARAFVNDPSRNVVDPRKASPRLSMIFQWNRAEFERDAGSLNRYVSRYVSNPAAARWLAGDAGPPEFLDYDWSPNQP